MKKYNYNIRCRMCRTGFNPKAKENAFLRLCPNCLEIRKEWLAKIGYDKPTPA